MKTVIKIIIAAVIINAAARVGMAAATYYQLKDETQQLVTFGANTSTGDLQNRIVQKALELKVPLDPGDIQVNREGLQTIASASYTQPVEVFPNYRYPINFRFSVEALSMAGLGQDQNPLKPK